MAATSGMWSYLGSASASLMIIGAIIQQYFPHLFQGHIQKYVQKFLSFLSPYAHITFEEYSGKYMKSNEPFSRIRTYLTGKSSASAKWLKADVVKDSQSVVLSMDNNEEVADEFRGVTVWWASQVKKSTNQSLWYPSSDEKRSYILTFHNRHRKLITESYISHVLEEGKAIAARTRQRKLYTNNPSDNWSGYKRTKWSEVVFDHPATFDTLAMETKLKEKIRQDLIKFSKGKEYYAKIGKAWKRGYLLYGPPGTGKSTMIAAMSKLLNYDVYDLELTTVKDNTELKRLLIDTSNKSIIVIEDIDCSVDLTGKRKKEEEEKDKKEEGMDPAKKAKGKDKEESKVTLSGLLNSIDGLWSACGEERIIVFTTNHKEKLDPALIRRGRMDLYVEMSYCCFEAFKVLAKNYHDIDSHPLFGEIGQLLEKTNMIPADVAENMMPKSEEDDVDTCLKNLIKALMAAKEEAKKKAEEEGRPKERTNLLRKMFKKMQTQPKC